MLLTLPHVLPRGSLECSTCGFSLPDGAPLALAPPLRDHVLTSGRDASTNRLQLHAKLGCGMVCIPGHTPPRAGACAIGAIGGGPASCMRRRRGFLAFGSDFAHAHAKLAATLRIFETTQARSNAAGTRWVLVARQPQQCGHNPEASKPWRDQSTCETLAASCVTLIPYTAPRTCNPNNICNKQRPDAASIEIEEAPKRVDKAQDDTEAADVFVPHFLQPHATKW